MKRKDESRKKSEKAESSIRKFSLRPVIDFGL